MKRRTVLRSCGVAATLALAGCGGSDVPGDGNGESPTTTEPQPTETSTPTTTPTTTTGELTPVLFDSTIDAGEGECADREDTATVSFDDDAGTVDIEGAISAPDPCHTATLASVDYDDSGDTLTVVVEAVDDSEDGTVCVSCIASIDYTVESVFENGLPGRVVVQHAGMETRTVTETTREEM